MSTLTSNKLRILANVNSLGEIGTPFARIVSKKAIPEYYDIIKRARCF